MYGTMQPVLRPFLCSNQESESKLNKKVISLNSEYEIRTYVKLKRKGGGERGIFG